MIDSVQFPYKHNDPKSGLHLGTAAITYIYTVWRSMITVHVHAYAVSVNQQLRALVSTDSSPL